VGPSLKTTNTELAKRGFDAVLWKCQYYSDRGRGHIKALPVAHFPFSDDNTQMQLTFES